MGFGCVEMSDLTLGLAGGFFLGILASSIAAILYDRWTRPKLTILSDTGPRAQGQVPGKPPHEFYHVRVRNQAPPWPIGGRRPAWDTKITIEVVDEFGKSLLSEPIAGRWTSQPEPLLPIALADRVINVVDLARLIMARKVNVHSHDDQQVPLALKFDGNMDCHIFSNESYLHPDWKNPKWKLGEGSHRLRLILYYQRGREIFHFRLRNLGTSRDDVVVEPW